MKACYLIGGAMGVGKTTLGQTLKQDLPRAVFLDGDWCWDAHPFQVTEETKAMVMDNICHVLNNFLHCSAYENVIFCWVMDRQSIIQDILGRLDTSACRVKVISLLASTEVLRGRILADVERGIRTPDVLERSLERLPLYAEVDSVKVDTDGRTVKEIAEEIMRL